MLLEPTCVPQTRHRSRIVFCAHVRLLAVLDDDVDEADGHDEEGEAGSGAPVDKDAFGLVVLEAGLKVVSVVRDGNSEKITFQNL